MAICGEFRSFVDFVWGQLAGTIGDGGWTNLGPEMRLACAYCLEELVSVILVRRGIEEL